MAIDSKHPKYVEMAEDWIDLRDAFAGERRVKEQGFRYLRPTAGQVLDGALNMAPTSTGWQSYLAYQSRAVFPDFFTIGVETLVGILNAKSAQIDLPADMEYLRQGATLTGEGLQALLRKLHEQQLITGRAGLLADLPDTPTLTPAQMYIVLYEAEKIINWDDGSFNDGFDKLNLVVLDESGWERHDDFEWKQVRKFRVLSLGELGENSAIGAYKVGTYQPAREQGDADAGQGSGVELITPTIKGQECSEIPFVFVGSKDLVRDPDRPPLIGLERLCMTIYRGEADYRQTLYLQGQDTLVVIGGVRGATADGNEVLRVGAGARIDLDMGGDAKYVGIGAESLEEQRTALENDRALAAVRTGQLLQPGKMSMESGEALKTRVAGQTATLTTVAITAAAALEQLLRSMARWAGSDESKVKVTPNLDFTNVAIQGQDIVQLQTAKGLGFPISAESLHELAVDRGLTRKTYEQELELIKKEDPILLEHAVTVAAAGKSLSGNNPQEQAGGPTASVRGVKPKTNKPKD